MLGLLRKNKIKSEWRVVAELEAGMQIAVPKDGVLEAHKSGQINSREQIDGDDVLWDEIESIKHIGTEQVWDIEVEGTHNFVGNNIFAHNTYMNNGLSVVGDINYTGNLLSVSDERLKDIQGAFNRGIADLKNVEPILYKYKPETGFDTTSVLVGFSAQNIQSAIPEAVSVGADGYLTLQDRPILATLVNAFKQLNASSTEMSAKLDALIASSTINTIDIWTADSTTGAIKLVTAQILDLQGQGIVNIREIISENGKWSIDENGVLIVEEVRAKDINASNSICMDEVCISKDDFKALLLNAGISNSTPTTTINSNPDDTEKPVITIQGSTTISFTITIPPTVYIDPGATVTDNKDTNLGVYASTYKDGIKLSDTAEITDTSTTTVYEIHYNATDNAGNKAVEVVRTVNITDPEPIIILNTATTTSDTATSTP